MSESPNRWLEFRLGDVVKLQGGFAFSSSLFGGGQIPVVRMSDLKGGCLDLSSAVCVSKKIFDLHVGVQLRAGDLLVGMSGSLENISRVRTNDLPALLNQRVGRFVMIDPTLLKYEYLVFIIQSRFYESQLRKEAIGAAQLNISSSQVEAIFLPLPPLPEQRRIAEILDTLDEAIRQTEALLAKLQQMKQGLLHDLLTRGIGADGALRPPHEEAPALYKDSPLGKIPKDWKKTPIAELADIFSGGTPSRNVPVFWNGGIPWVTPSELTNLQSKYITKTKEHISHAGMAGSSAILLPSNTLLVTTRATIGLVALSGMPITTNQGFKSIRFRFLALPDFYFYLFPLLISEMKRKASGTTFLEISAKEFGQIKLSVPPLSEQKRIVEILDAQDEAIQTQRLELAKLQMLKAGLMEDLLTGRVRVPVVEEGEG